MTYSRPENIVATIKVGSGPDTGITINGQELPLIPDSARHPVEVHMHGDGEQVLMIPFVVDEVELTIVHEDIQPWQTTRCSAPIRIPENPIRVYAYRDPFIRAEILKARIEQVLKSSD